MEDTYQICQIFLWLSFMILMVILCVFHFLIGARSFRQQTRFLNFWQIAILGCEDCSDSILFFPRLFFGRRQNLKLVALSGSTTKSHSVKNYKFPILTSPLTHTQNNTRSCSDSILFSPPLFFGRRQNLKLVALSGSTTKSHSVQNY